MDRKEEMQELRNRGFSYGAIGKLFGISRQRVHQVVGGYEALNGKLWYYHLCKAIWVRDQYVCQNCGAAGQALIVHHKDSNDNNNDPNNLVSLCNICHLALHRPHLIKPRLSEMGDLAEIIKKYQFCRIKSGERSISQTTMKQIETILELEHLT